MKDDTEKFWNNVKADHKRRYEFSKGKSKPKRGAVVSRELRLLREKQRRWLTRIKRAMTAISKLDRQIKRLEG